MDFNAAVLEVFVTGAKALVQVGILAALTVGATQVLKGVFAGTPTKKVSVFIALFLAFATGTSLLTPVGFQAASNFVDMIPGLGIVFKVAFYIADVGLISLLASQGSNKFFDFLTGKKATEAKTV